MTSFDAGVVTTTFVVAVFAAKSFFKRHTQHGSLFQYEDGEATQISIAEFTASQPYAQATSWAASGLIASVVASTSRGRGAFEDAEFMFVLSMRTASWALIVSQAMVVTRGIYSASERCRLWLYLGVSASSLAINLTWTLVVLFTRPEQAYDILQTNFEWLITTLQLSICVAIIALCGMVPRRPGLFCENEPVDTQDSVSVLDRILLSWTKPLLSISQAGSQAVFSDLPALNLRTRARPLVSGMKSLNKKPAPLPIAIFRSYPTQFTCEWALTLLRGLLAFAPHLCLFKFLALLENTESQSTSLWLWALGIGSLQLVQHLVNSHLVWYSMASLMIPLRSHLSGLLYEKSLRLESINASESRVEQTSDNSGSSYSSFEDGLGIDEEDVELVSQEVVNLMTTDASRVSDFAARQYIFLDIAVTSAVAVLFLSRVIGWISLGIGLGASMTLIPINMFVSAKYAKAQNTLAKKRDAKVRVVTEVLQAARQIKFDADEQRWENQIIAQRSGELSAQRNAYFWAVLIRLLWVASPILLSVAALVTYTLLNGELQASVAFTALATFSGLEYALSLIPYGIMQAVDASISCARIERHLMRTERQIHTQYRGRQIQFMGATISWPVGSTKQINENPFGLTDVTAQFPVGELSLVFGKSGSGKSLLLHSIVREAIVSKGGLTLPEQHFSSPNSEKISPEDWLVPTMIAWVPQLPWLQTGTVKDNIVFGYPWNQQRYESVLEATCLRHDLSVLDLGDMTLVGSNGVTLSGGQRSRIAFARALYSPAGTLIIDDIFSAVDAGTSKQMLEQALDGPLGRRRTRIIATHHYSLCASRASYALWIHNGTAEEQNVQDLVATSSRSVKGVLNGPGIEDAGSLDDAMVDIKVEKTFRNAELPMPYAEIPHAEFMEQGTVKWGVYHRYLEASASWLLWTVALGTSLSSQAALLGRAWALKDSANTSPQSQSNVLNGVYSGLHGKEPSSKVLLMMGIYIAVSAAAALLEAAKCAAVYTAGLRASHSLFEKLTHTILRAPLRWLDTVPLGRSLNRFAGDTVVMDSKLPGDAHMLSSAIFGFGVVTVAALFVSPVLIIPETVLVLACLHIASEYMPSARAVRRLESTARSPIVDLYCSSLIGISTIRAFGRVQQFTSRMMRYLDDQGRSSWALYLLQQWMDIRIGFVSAGFYISLVVIILLNDVEAPMAGLVLTLAFGFAIGTQDTIARYANVEFAMNAVERVIEYCDLDTEVDPDTPVPQNWPQRGSITIKGLYVAYAPELPVVLKGINVNIAAKERIGIVGRTGSGKSSLILSLLKALDQRDGEILIDGVNISSIPLKDLRSQVTLIPQDATLFQGTIRSNLDPFGQYSNEALLQSLRQVKLSRLEQPRATHDTESYVSNFELDCSVAEGGRNMSQGQRQLLCLARASLRASRIILMDEATSSIDTQADYHIQQAIRASFSESTLLVVAHRLTTVCDFDKILVIENGTVAEFGKPRELVARKGLFWDLINSSSDSETLKRKLMRRPVEDWSK